MIKVGIDTLAFYTPRYSFDLANLATLRNVDPDKYTLGLGQQSMSVIPPGEDIVTMGASAAQKALTGIAISQIDMLLFATESGIDQSKAAGLYLHELLNLPASCRVVELKQACYGGTAGLQLALPYLRENPDKKVLLIAADVARYCLNTPGESSQGAGAIALVLSANPRLMTIESESGFVSENVMDFWRPNYLHEAIVDGKYSSKIYLTMLEKSWAQYRHKSSRQFSDHAYFCYHTPVPRLVEKAHLHLLKCNDALQLANEDRQIQFALTYARQIGNTYTASLYIALASLLDLADEDLAHKRIGFYSYGSGCVAEYFSGVMVSGYQARLHTNYHAELLAKRIALSAKEYEAFYHHQYVEDGSTQTVPVYETGGFRLAKMEAHKRVYEALPTVVAMTGAIPVKKPPMPHLKISQKESREKSGMIKVLAPGKLILSGEHAVVYGNPALAMAVNRYVTATITPDRTQELLPQILLDLSDIAHHSQLNFHTLRRVKERIKNKYHRFIRGDFSIREVLQKPFELAQFALGMVADSFNIALPHGIKLQLQSDVPIGCGMGSSAATILSVMHAVSHYLQTPLPEESLYKLALEAENMQHGRSSGLDLQVALTGGCLYKHEENIQKRFVPQSPMYLVNTGTPICTTGQCIEKVAPLFQSRSLQEAFAAVTLAMDAGLKQQSWQRMAEAIRENHQLLTHIGVVPTKVQTFIADIEALGGAAKICGAGAVAGENAGAVLIMHPPDAASYLSTSAQALAKRFGYQMTSISGEMRGVHAA